MVVDSSVLVAILLGEPDRSDLVSQLSRADSRLLSAASAFETGMVLEARRGEAMGTEFDLFLVRTNIEIVPVDAGQVQFARIAWRRYGKGRHPAALNFGDCFVYALAKMMGEPVLAKGKEFTLTDIEMVKFP